LQEPSVQGMSHQSRFAGYMFTYYNSKATEERKARIERINEQVPLQLCLNVYNYGPSNPSRLWQPRHFVGLFPIRVGFNMHASPSITTEAGHYKDSIF